MKENITRTKEKRETNTSMPNLSIYLACLPFLFYKFTSVNIE